MDAATVGQTRLDRHSLGTEHEPSWNPRSSRSSNFKRALATRFTHSPAQDIVRRFLWSIQRGVYGVFEQDRRHLHWAGMGPFC